MFILIKKKGEFGMLENSTKEDGLQEDGDLNFKAKAQKLLDKFLDDHSTNAIGKRIIGDHDLAEK